MARALIRDAAPADAAAVAAVYAPAVLTGTASFELEPPSPAEMAARMRKVQAAGWPWLVAEAEGRVAGYAYAAQFRERPAYRHCCESSVYVAPDAQRGGIGRALMAALIERAAACGFTQMLAVIGDSANAPSIGLHAVLGFRHVGTLQKVGWKLDRWIDSVWMQRAL